MTSLDDQIVENEVERKKLEYLKNEEENGLLPSVMRVVAKSACCSWTDQNIHKLGFKEETLHFGDGIRIKFPNRWSLFGLTYDLHKAGFKVEQISWGRNESFMLVSVGD